MDTTELEFNRARRIGARIGLVPMIDVIFQLLIFFAATMSFADSRGMKVALPESVSLDPGTMETIVVAIDATGVYYVEGVVVPGSALADELRGRLGERPAAAIRIEADRSADIELAVRALDAARIAGGREALLATMPPTR